MEPLTWTGPLGEFLNFPTAMAFTGFILLIAAALAENLVEGRLAETDGAGVAGEGADRVLSLGGLFAIALATLAVLLAWLLLRASLGAGDADPVLGLTQMLPISIGLGVLLCLFGVGIPDGLSALLMKLFGAALLLLLLLYLVIPFYTGYGSTGIIGELSRRFWLVWLLLIVTFVASIAMKRNLGLYGKLFDSTVGMIGLGLVLFWVYTALVTMLANVLPAWGMAAAASETWSFLGWLQHIDLHIATFDPLDSPNDGLEARRIKNGVPGLVATEGALYPHYLLGGDNLARDVFSRMVAGSAIVIQIAPLATLFAFMVGITLGLPAGYYGDMKMMSAKSRPSFLAAAAALLIAALTFLGITALSGSSLAGAIAGVLALPVAFILAQRLDYEDFKRISEGSPLTANLGFAAAIAAAIVAVSIGSGLGDEIQTFSPLTLVIAGAAGLIVLGIALSVGLDTGLSFLANLILAFPVILLFYLLVTPEIVQTGLPNYMAMVLFVFPLIFFTVLIVSRKRYQPLKMVRTLVLVMVPALLLYVAVVTEPFGKIDLMGWLTPGGRPAITDTSDGSVWLDRFDLFNIPGGVLVVFVSVVFVNSPTVFRIVRGLALDIKTRDYVAAAQTRGERPWYIMLWEMLPNARGPLIVDFCLRIGYTTILLGTLGFFGLGLPPESPDWGSTINEGRKLLSIHLHPALPPAIALLTLVLGLNLLADGLREESLKD